MNEVITTVPKLDIEIRDDYLDVESIGNDKFLFHFFIFSLSFIIFIIFSYLFNFYSF